VVVPVGCPLESVKVTTTCSAVAVSTGMPCSSLIVMTIGGRFSSGEAPWAVSKKYAPWRTLILWRPHLARSSGVHAHEPSSSSASDSQASHTPPSPMYSFAASQSRFQFFQQFSPWNTNAGPLQVTTPQVSTISPLLNFAGPSGTAGQSSCSSQNPTTSVVEPTASRFLSQDDAKYPPLSSGPYDNNSATKPTVGPDSCPCFDGAGIRRSKDDLLPYAVDRFQPWDPFQDGRYSSHSGP